MSSSPVLLIITVHSLPLLALAWCGVDLLGHLDQTDLLEVVLSEEPAAANRRCQGLPLLDGDALQLLRLHATTETSHIKTKLPGVTVLQWFTKTF